MDIFIIFTTVFILIITTSFFYNRFFMAPWIPTRKKDLERISKIIDIKPWQTYFEMWCWTWIVCNHIWKNNPESKIVWIEISIWLFLYTKIKNLFFWPKNVKIIFWNAFKKDFSEFDFIYVYWLPTFLNKEIREKAEKEMKKWSKIISYEFKIKNWKWKISEDVLEWNRKKIMIYTK